MNRWYCYREVGDRRLVAYIVTAGHSAEAPNSALRNFCKELPDTWFWVFVLRKLPITQWKVDRKPCRARRDANRLERKLCRSSGGRSELAKIWSCTVGADGTTTLFELAALFCRPPVCSIEKSFGRNLPLSTCSARQQLLALCYVRGWMHPGRHSCCCKTEATAGRFLCSAAGGTVLEYHDLAPWRGGPPFRIAGPGARWKSTAPHLDQEMRPLHKRVRRGADGRT